MAVLRAARPIEMASKFQPRKKQSRFLDSGAAYTPEFLAKVTADSLDTTDTCLLLLQ